MVKLNDTGASLGGPRLVPQLWLVPQLPQESAPLLALLSAQERCWGEALAAPRRRTYWCSRAAMRVLIGGVLEQPPQQLPLHSAPGQPPLLAAGLGWVSLSHAAGTLLIAWSPAPIGVDLEAATRSFDAHALMSRFFPATEQEQLTHLAPEPLRQAVLRSWVAKEAAIKWRHRSLASELKEWVLDHRSGWLRHSSDGTALRPCEGEWTGEWPGDAGPWRWAAAGEGLMQTELRPLIWRFDCA